MGMVSVLSHSFLYVIFTVANFGLRESWTTSLSYTRKFSLFRRFVNRKKGLVLPKMYMTLMSGSREPTGSNSIILTSVFGTT